MGESLTEVERIRQLVLLSDEEILRKFAAEALGRQAVPLDPRDLLERGKRMFEVQSAKLQSAICGSAQLRTFATGKNDAAEIAIEIMKVISSLVTKVALVPVCVLLAKKGLKNLCQKDWEVK